MLRSASGPVEPSGTGDWSPATGVIRVHIQDPGPGHSFDFEAHEARAETELVLEHRGLILMKHLSRNFQSERNGSSLQLEFSAD